VNVLAASVQVELVGMLVVKRLATKLPRLSDALIHVVHYLLLLGLAFNPEIEHRDGLREVAYRLCCLFGLTSHRWMT